MKILARYGVQTLSVLLAFGMALGTTRAAVIKIDDLTDTITVTVDGANITVERLPNTQEAIRFTFTSTVVSAFTGSVSTDFISLVGGGEESDRLFLSFTQGTPNISVLFASDPNLDAVPPAQTRFMRIIEDGTFQDTIYYRRVTAGGQTGTFTEEKPAAALLIDTYQVRSDVEPEPSSLLLLSIGALGLLGYGWRRQRAP
jgi:hypothetical protein